jgi:hypothetical protein
MFSNANSVIVIYPNSSQIQAPMADSKPITAVTIITVGVIPFRPMASSCSSSSSAGNENTAMNTSGAIRLYRNILFSFVSVEIYLLYL